MAIPEDMFTQRVVCQYLEFTAISNATRVASQDVNARKVLQENNYIFTKYY